METGFLFCLLALAVESVPRFVVSGAAVPSAPNLPQPQSASPPNLRQPQPCLSTEPAAAPNLPQHRTWFGATTSQDCESTEIPILELGRLSESARRNRRVLARADREIHHSLLTHCYSVFFVAVGNLEFLYSIS